MILNKHACVCMWKMVYAVATTLKGGVSSTAVCGKMASQVARWNPKRDLRQSQGRELTGQSPYG